MHTEKENGNVAADYMVEAKACVARLRSAQTTLKLKDNKFVGRFKGADNSILLGSPRTWERMRKDEWDENRPEKWLPKLRQACAQLDGGTPVRRVYEDLPFFVEASKELSRLESQTNDRRVMVVLAPTGTGKSVWARRAVDEERDKRIYIRGNPSWRENGVGICCAIYERLTGERMEYVGFGAALSKLTLHLAASDKTIFLDEGHEGGIMLMTLIRHLVDETPSRFVYLAYPTEYNRVVGASTGTLAEARQFIGRSLKPIFDDYKAGTRKEDVIVILRHAGFSADQARALGGDVTRTVLVREGLRTLDDALERAREMAQESDKDEIDGPILLEALKEITGTTGDEGKRLAEKLGAEK